MSFFYSYDFFLSFAGFSENAKNRQSGPVLGCILGVKV